MHSRRHFFRDSAALAASTLGFPHLARSAEQLHLQPGQTPRHIIHLVADGMSAGTLTCADYLSQALRGRGLAWLDLYKNPAAHAGFMNMRSLNSMVTDSSAASSSWGSGTRIINGMLNQLPDETPLKTLYELLGDSGWKRGLVTTTEITHATPAGFATCVRDREKGTMIAAQYLERRVEVLLGGGEKFFDPQYRKDRRDLLAVYRKADYCVMNSAEQLKTAPRGQRWLGTFARSHLPFTLDHLLDPQALAKVPTLASMTAAALDWLGQTPHFILQVEGGRVDHACHNNDAVAALRDMIAFDEAIEICLAFQVEVPDTLLVITTDHGNGNPGLNGMGWEYGQSTWLFRNLKEVKCSFPEILRQLKHRPALEPEKPENYDELEKAREKAMTRAERQAEKLRKKQEEADVAAPKEAAEIIYAATGYKVPVRKAELLVPHLQKKGEAMYDLMKEDVCALGQLLANYLGIAFTGNVHTADYVPVLALGPGAERFRGFIQNTQVFEHYLEFANLDFRNPKEPLLTAQGPEAPAVEGTDAYKYA